MKIETKQSFLQNETYSLTGNEPTTLWIIPQIIREFHKRIKLKLLEVKIEGSGGNQTCDLAHPKRESYH